MLNKCHCKDIIKNNFTAAAKHAILLTPWDVFSLADCSACRSLQNIIPVYVNKLQKIKIIIAKQLNIIR